MLSHIGTPQPLDAVSLLAFLPEQEEVAAALRSLAGALSAHFSIPVTWAFGPRYLHSTGQLHKGGPDRISFVVLTCDPARRLSIPGQQFDLGQLRLAQAIGDLEALRDVGRKVLHLHLGAQVAEALRSMLEAARG